MHLHEIKYAEGFKQSTGVSHAIHLLDNYGNDMPFIKATQQRPWWLRNLMFFSPVFHKAEL